MKFKCVVTTIICVIFYFTSVPVLALNAEEVYQRVHGSILIIFVLKNKDSDVDKKNVETYGSAVAVTHNIIATNCHLAKDGKRLIVAVNNKPYDAEIVAKNLNQDICLLKIQDVTLVPIKLRPSRDLNIGEDVYAIGNPNLLEKYIARGIYSKYDTDDNGIWLLSDVATAPGSSGGGLFDHDGNLIGITTGGEGALKNITYSAAVDWIIQKLDINPVYRDSYGASKNDSTVSSKIPQPQQSESIKKPDSKLEKIGEYGDSKIALYKKQNGCFIFFPGKNKQGKIESSAIWFPEEDKTIIIFPRIASASKVLDALRADDLLAEIDKKKVTYSGSYFYFEDSRYQLVGYQKPDGKYSVVAVTFEKPITKYLIDGDKFVVVLNSSSLDDAENVRTFGLWGFTEALYDYHKYCRK